MNLFNWKSDKEVELAREALKKAKNNLAKVNMNFLTVSSFDFQLEKNVWKQLPPEVASGVDTMGIHIGNDYRSILTYYRPSSFILPHCHPNEYEVIKIMEGSAVDLVNGTRLERGDIYTISKNEVHHIVTEGEECYMYILFTEFEKYLSLPYKEEKQAERTIKQKLWSTIN